MEATIKIVGVQFKDDNCLEYDKNDMELWHCKYYTYWHCKLFDVNLPEDTFRCQECKEIEWK
jgi:hypothetical protein